jgi:hypothetical protein
MSKALSPFRYFLSSPKVDQPRQHPLGAGLIRQQMRWSELPMPCSARAAITSGAHDSIGQADKCHDDPAEAGDLRNLPTTASSCSSAGSVLLPVSPEHSTGGPSFQRRQCAHCRAFWDGNSTRHATAGQQLSRLLRASTRRESALRHINFSSRQAPSAPGSHYREPLIQTRGSNWGNVSPGPQSTTCLMAVRTRAAASRIADLPGQGLPQ